VGLRGYGQRDPLNEYKTEGFALFEAMLAKLREVTTAQMMRVELADEAPMELIDEDMSGFDVQHLDPLTGSDEMAGPETLSPGGLHGLAMQRGRKGEAPDPENPETWGKIPRNAPCPCGSGKKYKHCHGKLA